MSGSSEMGKRVMSVGRHTPFAQQTGIFPLSELKRQGSPPPWLEGKVLDERGGGVVGIPQLIPQNVRRPAPKSAAADAHAWAVVCLAKLRHGSGAGTAWRRAPTPHHLQREDIGLDGGGRERRGFFVCIL